MADLKKERATKFNEMFRRIQESSLYQGKLADQPINDVTLEQIDTLPLTTKEDLREAGIFGHLAVDKKKIAQYHESTGTTGEPSAS